MWFRNVSLFTDASHNPRLGTIGGGWWAVFEGQRVNGQVRRRDVPDSSEAEVRVACGAIKLLLASPKFQAWREASDTPVRLILVVDALAIQTAFAHPLRRLGRLTVETSELLAREGITLKINHVPGHQKSTTPRNWVNNWCDKMAKAARKTLEGAPA